MQCDVRQLHPDDLQKTWDFIKKAQEIDVANHSEENYWLIMLDGLHKANRWRSVITVFEYDQEYTSARIEFYPPRGGNIRFDINVNNGKIMEEIVGLLVKYGHAGKNRISAFI